MATSDSIPGYAVINHEAGDTLKRTITVKLAGVGINLIGSTPVLTISDETGDLITAGISAGLIGTDLAHGTIDLFVQTAGLLEKEKVYTYKYKNTFPDGEIKTFLEAPLNTKKKCLPVKAVCTTSNGDTTVIILGDDITVDLSLRGPQGIPGTSVANLNDVPDSATRFALTAAQRDYLIALMAINNTPQ